MKQILYHQRSRKRGSRQPRDTCYCGRPTIWGNPYVAVRILGIWVVRARGEIFEKRIWDNQIDAARRAMQLYRHALLRDGLETLSKLAEYNYLSCWCKPGEPCHVQDVLLPLVNDYLRKVEG